MTLEKFFEFISKYLFSGILVFGNFYKFFSKLSENKKKYLFHLMLKKIYGNLILTYKPSRINHNLCTER